jgi:hypothetical protein
MRPSSPLVRRCCRSLRCSERTPRRQTSARVVALTALAIVMVPSAAVAQAKDPAWQWRATIYGWLPSISGSTNLPASGGGGDVNVDVGNILDALDFVFMGQLEARRGRWGAFSDLVYLDLSDTASGVRSLSISGPGGAITIPVDVSLEGGLALSGNSWMLAGTFTSIERQGFELLTLGGVRSLRIDSTLNWTASGNIGSLPLIARSGSASAEPRYWDAIVGVRGRAILGAGGWYLPFYVDIGTGDSNRTWQSAVGIGYRSSWGEITVVHRRLQYDLESDSPLRELGFSGIALGLSWRW